MTCRDCWFDLTLWTLTLCTLFLGWMQKQSGRAIWGIPEEDQSSFKCTAEFSPQVPENLTRAWWMGSCQVVRLLSVWIARGPTSLLQGDFKFKQQSYFDVCLFLRKEKAQCIWKHTLRVCRMVRLGKPRWLIKTLLNVDYKATNWRSGGWRVKCNQIQC